jgi:hypothetical protein
MTTATLSRCITINDYATKVIEEASKIGGTEGISLLLKEPSFRAEVEKLGSVTIYFTFLEKEDNKFKRRRVHFTPQGLIERINDQEKVIGNWGFKYVGEDFNLKNLPRELENICRCHNATVREVKVIDGILEKSPDVCAALIPEWVKPRPYLSRLLSLSEFFWHNIFEGGEETVSTVINSFIAAKKYLDFIQQHPELRSLQLADRFSKDEKEKRLEEKRIEAIKRKYPELGTEEKKRSGELVIGVGKSSIGQWNPFDILALTKGDLSFYKELESGLGNSNMFLYMEKDGYGCNGEVFIGIRPYGEKKESIKPHLEKLPHGALIGFYSIAQAKMDGEYVAVIETMQSDLLKKLNKTPLVPNRERRGYTNGKNHWLRHTLPRLEDALGKTGVSAVIIPTIDVILENRNVSGGLKDSMSVKELYEMPGNLGYQIGLGEVSFLNGTIIEGKYWIKPLN